MPEEKTPMNYYLAIAPQFTQDDTLIGYDIHSRNEGIPEEVIIVLLRNWIRMVETKYHYQFRAAHP